MEITLCLVVTGLSLTCAVDTKKIIPDNVRIPHIHHPLVNYKGFQGTNYLKDSFVSLGIIGGTASNIKQHPYQVAIDNDKTFVCAGALLNRIWVVALASCTAGSRTSDLTVRVGSDYSAYGGTVYNVTEQLTHPNFNYTSLDYDFSLLKIKTYLCFSEEVGQVSLSVTSPRPRYAGVISGWGTDGSNSTSKLHQLTMSVVPPQKCRQQYKVTHNAVTDRMFCAAAGSSGPCFNDFGDPFVVNGTLYGLYSWSRGCALPDYPAVFSNLAAVGEWIHQTMNNACSCGVY